MNHTNGTTIHSFLGISIGAGGPGCEAFADDGWGPAGNVNTTYPVSNPNNWGQPFVTGPGQLIEPVPWWQFW